MNYKYLSLFERNSSIKVTAIFASVMHARSNNLCSVNKLDNRTLVSFYPQILVGWVNGELYFRFNALLAVKLTYNYRVILSKNIWTAMLINDLEFCAIPIGLLNIFDQFLLIYFFIYRATVLLKCHGKSYKYRFYFFFSKILLQLLLWMPIVPNAMSSCSNHPPPHIR